MNEDMKGAEQDQRVEARWHQVHSVEVFRQCRDRARELGIKVNFPWPTDEEFEQMLDPNYETLEQILHRYAAELEES